MKTYYTTIEVKENDSLVVRVVNSLRALAIQWVDGRNRRIAVRKTAVLKHTRHEMGITALRRWVLACLCLMISPFVCNAQETMPQDQWYVSHTFGSYGSGDGQLSFNGYSSSSGLTIGPDSLLYVAENSNRRIQVFTKEGVFVLKWNMPNSANPTGLDFGPDGNLYVVSTSKVFVYTPQGNLLRSWGSSGSGNGQFGQAHGIAVSKDSRVYIADYGNSRIQYFDLNGTFLGKFGQYGTAPGEFISVYDVAVDTNGNIYVADYGNHTYNRLQMFDSTHTFVAHNSNTNFYGFNVRVTKDGMILYDKGLSTNQISINKPFNNSAKMLATNLTSMNGFDLAGITIAPNGDVFLAIGNSSNYSHITVLRRGYAHTSSLEVPKPTVISAKQRTGTFARRY